MKIVNRVISQDWEFLHTLLISSQREFLNSWSKTRAGKTNGGKISTKLINFMTLTTETKDLYTFIFNCSVMKKKNIYFYSYLNVLTADFLYVLMKHLYE